MATKKYFIITYGCQMNRSDSERIAASFEKKGYKKSSKEEDADLIVINMCSIRQSAVNRVYGKLIKLKKLKTNNPKLKLFLAGCVLRRDWKKFKENFDSFLENKDFLRFSPICGEKALIPISFGCSNYCTYCVVPYTRGNLICRDHKEIIAEIKKFVGRGAKEIWLLGQNVNDYKDREIDFVGLLEMATSIPGKFRVGFLSPHPKNFSDELIELIAKNKKISRKINLPVQSGDDEILKAMNRPYTTKKYMELVKKIRKKIPDVDLTTDIIVGFPGETERQFQNTVKLVKKLNFNVAFISKYSQRPGTLAAKKLKDDIPIKEKIRRYKILNELINVRHK